MAINKTNDTSNNNQYVLLYINFTSTLSPSSLCEHNLIFFSHRPRVNLMWCLLFYDYYAVPLWLIQHLDQPVTW